MIQPGGGGYPGIPLCGLYASKHSLPSVPPHSLSICLTRSLLTFCPRFSVLETFSSSDSVVDLVLLGNSLVRDSGSSCRLLPPQPRNSRGLSQVKITFLLALSGPSTRRTRLNTFNSNINKSKLNTPDTLPNYYFIISGADFVLWRFHELLQKEKTISRHYCINIALP